MLDRHGRAERRPEPSGLRIVVNYDLPWAIIRLIQRAGRVDRIGQQADDILCYSFLPADGVERIIRLRARVRQRLQENAEVVGTDEAFFEDDDDDQAVVDLYNEKAGILDGDDDTRSRPGLLRLPDLEERHRRRPEPAEDDPGLPDVVYSTKRAHAERRAARRACWSICAPPRATTPWPGWTSDGNSVTESQFAILRPPSARPIRRRFRARGAPRAGAQGRRADRRRGEARSAASSAGHRARASAPTSGSSAMPRVKGTLFDTAGAAARPSRTSTAIRCARRPLTRLTASCVRDHRRGAGRAGDRAARRGPAVPESTKRSKPSEPQIICSLGLAQPTEDDEPCRSTSARCAAPARRTSTSRPVHRGAGLGRTTPATLAVIASTARASRSRPSPQKRGMVGFECAAADGDASRPRHAPARSSTQVAKSVHEHLIIFTDAGRDRAGLAVGRARGRQARRLPEHAFTAASRRRACSEARRPSPSSLDEEEEPDHRRRRRRESEAAFDVERVTKRSTTASRPSTTPSSSSSRASPTRRPASGTPR